MRIANALNIVVGGTSEEIKKLQPHNYQNLPEKFSGAVLRLMQELYRLQFATRKNRGQARIVVNRSKDRAYYTPNHYLSFYGVDIEKYCAGRGSDDA